MPARPLGRAALALSALAAFTAGVVGCAGPRAPAGAGAPAPAAPATPVAPGAPVRPANPPRATAAAAPSGPAQVRILALNDLHGQLDPALELGKRAAGGAPALAAWLRAAQRGRDEETVVVSAGDLVGASPALSALLRDEPTVRFLELFANADCRGGFTGAAPPERPTRCNVVATVGNHELDRGLPGLLRLVRGGAGEGLPYGDGPWPGARFPWVSANLKTGAGEPALPPYALVDVGGATVAFVGAVLRGAPAILAAERSAGLAFEDEATAVNRWVPELQRRGVHAIVVLLHQGGEQAPYTGPTRDGARVQGEVAAIAARLDPDVDVVIAAHTHRFTNAWVPRPGAGPVLVTQAWSRGTAFAQIDLTIDPASHDVTARSARVVTAWDDEGPGATPDAAAAALVQDAAARVAPLTGRVVGFAAGTVPAAPGSAGESPLGLLVADAHRAAVGADVGFTNLGGLRADLPAGRLTWGDLFAAQPFGNRVVRLTLTGAQLQAVLEEQARGAGPARLLQPSGLSYRWSDAAPRGQHATEVRIDGRPLDPAARYTVAVNGFLSGGGDGFRAFRHALERLDGPVDVDALADHLKRLPQPFTAPPGGRVVR